MLKVAKVEGSVLTPDKMLKVKKQLTIANLSRYKLSNPNFPALSKIVKDISPISELLDSFTGVFDESGQIKDSASEELFRIRSSLRALKGEATSKLRKFINNPAISKNLADRNIHIRNDRYVVAVRAEKVPALKGMVIDVSSSGKTVFFEPEIIVSINNKVALWKEKELREIRRILRQITSRIGYHARALTENQQILAYLDALFAKARFALKYRANVPKVGKEAKIRIVQGMHPILYRIKKGETVPMDLELGQSFRTLVITGPNTGGKTVALKTVGLLTLMAMSAIPVTASADSFFGVFDKVLVDIGDEQAIESSLSTFSSHIVRIKEIVELANRRSLVLIDELGTGTDPEEGSALALAIVEHLHQKGSINVITTHHGELKLLAYSTPGMENASVEFDVDSLKPTYRLLVGIPGESNAFVIAERLGLKAEIVERAKQIKGERLKGKGEIIEWIISAKREVEKSLEEARSLMIKAEEKLKEAEIEANRIKEEALTEALKIVEEAKSSIKSAKKESSHKIVQVANEVRRRMIKEKEEKVKSHLEEGAIVEIPSFNLKGRVVQVKGRKVEVDTGKMKMTVPIVSVVPTGEKVSLEKESSREISVSIERERELFFPELNLIGKRVNDAISELERFLNDATLLEIKNLKIIHGKGQGILKKAVHEYLKDHPLVKSFRLADEREGGSGVTLVELVW